MSLPNVSSSVSSSASTNVSSSTGRLVSLDQFRGYTVLGMLLVNYFGGYKVCPQVWKHTHDYCSYADTIMPQFLFAVGFALRLTIGRRLQTQGHDAALYSRIIRRMLGLILVALVVHGSGIGPRAENWSKLVELGWWHALAEPLKRSWFQTLMHIGVTSLWILPVIGSKASWRVLWMAGSALLHVLLSYQFNFVWCNTDPNAIDGGPLGFLTWAVPAIVGTLACDWFVDQARDHGRARVVVKSMFVSLGLMVLGYGLSCGTRFYDVPAQSGELLAKTKLAAAPVWPTAEQIADRHAEGQWSAWLAEPPFVKPPDQTARKWNYWMMSQRAGTLSYLTFSAGFSLAVFVLFYGLCDGLGWQLGVFRTFGTNALVAYILHSMVSSAVQPFFPKDSPFWYAYTGLALFFAINWVCLRSLEKQGIFLRV
ncbi:MAG: hypothetical protein IT423_04935 [Pirellulaceae bacterium]|nr:hypothetical protein [Pirellulaceae bacterium]